MADEAKPEKKDERRGPGLVGWSLVIVFVLLAVLYG